MRKLSILDFWARINKTADCWFWTGAKDLDGPKQRGDLRGSKNAQAKLTDQQVTEIRSLVGTMPQYKIAEKYDVSSALVSLIVNKKIWTHV